MKYVIGITGGVGSGKSIVLDYLKSNHGAAVYQMDEIAKKLKESDDIQSQILSAFGTTDPSELSDVIFSDKNKLELINSIIHPAVRKTVDD
ncbi:MAG: dephospho-CoA kinase, partial [Lachnospiraceae bacterium]|nr:dephospho-CoA kinase [Candidatus Minthocola equi]